ncbi:hypothetical protein C5Y93_27105 [Blastopirellula marina]|uniref:DUF6985 domain-containing protein n=2 Tax=Blastopirellula marina TaxID=124 RepID=A0A2S8GC71_9BACT|nr:hypothetical protein C5Y93_27105 [Blastopirellula marina]
MSDFLDRFVRAPGLGNRYEWKSATKPVFRNAVVKFVPPDINEPYGDSEFDITAFCESGNVPGSLHENAWNFLEANADTIEANLRRKLFVHHMKGYRGFVDEIVPDLDDDELEEWDAIRDAIAWETPIAIDSMYELIGVGLLEAGLDDCGCCYFDFNCGWDEEHGISILMHKTNVLAADGISGFANCGSELIPCVQAIQQYDLDEGDFSLLET